MQQPSLAASEICQTSILFSVMLPDFFTVLAAKQAQFAVVATAWQFGNSWCF